MNPDYAIDHHDKLGRGMSFRPVLNAGDAGYTC